MSEQVSGQAGDASDYGKVDIEIDQLLTEELELRQNLGTDIEEDGFYANLGDQPIAFLLSDLYTAANQPIPAEYDKYRAYELWLVPHRVSIIRRRGRAEVTSVGIEVKYETGGKTCCVEALIPHHQFIDRGSLSIRVKLGGKGEIASGVGFPIGDTIEIPGLGRAGLAAHACACGEAGVMLSASVATPAVQAVGIGSSSCEWGFNLDTKFLYGQDIQSWSILVLPKRRSAQSGVLKYQMRFYVTLRTFFLTTRRQSDWQMIECTLANQ